MECSENRSDVFITRYPGNESGGSVLHWGALKYESDVQVPIGERK